MQASRQGTAMRSRRTCGMRGKMATPPRRRFGLRALSISDKAVSQCYAWGWSAGRGRPVESITTPPRRDKPIPTGRVRRTAKVGGLVGGQAARAYANKAANLTRGEEAREDA